MLSFSIYLLAFVLNLCLIASQPCPTNTQLANFQQLTHTLQIISGGNKITQSYPFTFSSSSFQSLPTAITSINLYNCPTFSQIDYRIDTGVTNTSGTIKFQSTMMNWVQVGVIVWLNARPDIVSGTLTLQNIAKGKSSPVDVNTPRLIPFFANIHTIYMNFINSLSVISDNTQYSVLCQYSSKTEKTYTAKITAGPSTTIKFIKVDYMIYNTNSSIIFMYGSTIQSRLVSNDPIYIKAHRNFAPITNFMFGVDSLTLSEKNLMLNMNLDKDMIFQISTSTKIKKFRALIIFIGNFMSQICSKCSQKYVYGDTCISSCPQLTYPYEKYADRGASCLTCSKKVNQILNQQKTGCKCLPGYTLTNQYCSQNNSTNPIMNRYIKNINGPSLHNYTYPLVDLVEISSNNQNTNSSTLVKNSSVIIKNITNSIANTIINTSSIIGNKNTITGLGTSGTMVSGTNSNQTSLITVGQKAKKDSDTLDVSQPNIIITNITSTSTTSIKNTTTIDLSTSTNKNSSSTNNLNLNLIPLETNTNQTNQMNKTIITSTTLVINEIKNSSRVRISDNTRNNVNFAMTLNQANNSTIPPPTSILNATILAISNLSTPTIGGVNMTKISSTSIPSLSANQPIASSVTIAQTLTAEQIHNKCPNNSKFDSTTSKCQCDQFSMHIDQTTCERCIVGNYKNPQTLICESCMGGCQQCTNYTVCIKCFVGYFDHTMGMCLPGTAPQVSTPVVVAPTSIPNTTATSNTTKIDTITTGNKTTTTTTVTTTTTITTTTTPSTSTTTGVVNNTSIAHQNSSFSTDSGFGNFGDANDPWGTSSNQDFGHSPVNNPDFSSSGSSTIQSNSTTTSINKTVTTVPTSINSSTSNNITAPTNNINTTIPTPTPTPTPPQIPTSCKQNMILVNGVCECNQVTVPNGNECTPCPATQFKFGTECFPCSPNCQICQSPQGCDKCLQGYAFNEINLCDVPYCKKNQSFLLIACQCDHSSVESTSGFCKPCQVNQIKIINQTSLFPECHNCSIYIDHCDICQSNQRCTHCLPNFALVSDRDCSCKEPNKIVNDGGCCPVNFMYVVANRTCVPQPITPTPTPTPTVTNNTSSNTTKNVTNKNITNSTTPIPIPVVPVVPVPPKCKQFEILQGLNCVCDLQSVNISGKCQHCGQGLFKYPGNSEQCFKCPDNCQHCFSLQTCDICRAGYVFNLTTKTCQDTNKPVLQCSTNEQIINNKCQCIKQTARNSVNGQCQKMCPSGKFLIENQCFECPQGCHSCKFSATAIQCTQCQSGLQLNQQTFLCCRNHQFYDQLSKTCSCKAGFYFIQGFCGQCNPGYVYNSSTQVCQASAQPPTQNITTINTTQPTQPTTQNTSTIIVPPVVPVVPVTPTQNCKPDEQFNGIICQCKNQSLRMPDGSCRCPDGQFNNNKKCSICVNNCVKCSSLSICNECQPGYTGNQCQSCAKDYNKIAGLVPIRCQKKPCGNSIIDKQEQCDDGNSDSNDGCSSQCLIQNGYACQNQLFPCTTVIQILKKQSDSITSTGIFSTFTYSAQELQPNFKEIVILNGTKPSNIRFIKRNSPSDPYQKTVKVFLDYCGTLPNQNITVKYVTNSSKGIVNYVSQYNLGQKLIIPRTTVSRAIKQDQFLH